MLRGLRRQTSCLWAGVLGCLRPLSLMQPSAAQKAVDASAPANPFSSTLLGGQRYLLTSAGGDIVISAQCARVVGRNPATACFVPPADAPPLESSANKDEEGVSCGFEVLQRIHNAHSGPVTAVRWFGDSGGAAGAGYASCDSGDLARGEVLCVCLCDCSDGGRQTCVWPPVRIAILTRLPCSCRCDLCIVFH